MLLCWCHGSLIREVGRNSILLPQCWSLHPARTRTASVCCCGARTESMLPQWRIHVQCLSRHVAAAALRAVSWRHASESRAAKGRCGDCRAHHSRDASVYVYLAQRDALAMGGQGIVLLPAGGKDHNRAYGHGAHVDPCEAGSPLSEHFPRGQHASQQVNAEKH